MGSRLLHYELVEEIGRGGMGVVYKARDTHLNRVVAVKVLPPDKVGDPDRRQRFIQEARAPSALNHPNIVTIHDINSDRGTDFIVMEYVEGKTLDELLPPKGLRPTQALKYVVPIADALARGPWRRHPASGPEAVQHHADRRGPHQAGGLRPGQAARSS